MATNKKKTLKGALVAAAISAARMLAASHSAHADELLYSREDDARPLASYYVPEMQAPGTALEYVEDLLGIARAPAKLRAVTNVQNHNVAYDLDSDKVYIYTYEIPDDDEENYEGDRNIIAEVDSDRLIVFETNRGPIDPQTIKADIAARAGSDDERKNALKAYADYLEHPAPQRPLPSSQAFAVPKPR